MENGSHICENILFRYIFPEISYLDTSFLKISYLDTSFLKISFWFRGVETINENKNCVKNGQMRAEIANVIICFKFAHMPSPSHGTISLNYF